MTETRGPVKLPVHLRPEHFADVSACPVVNAIVAALPGAPPGSRPLDPGEESRDIWVDTDPAGFYRLMRRLELPDGGLVRDADLVKIGAYGGGNTTGWLELPPALAAVVGAPDQVVDVRADVEIPRWIVYETDWYELRMALGLQRPSYTPNARMLAVGAQVMRMTAFRNCVDLGSIPWAMFLGNLLLAVSSDALGLLELWTRPKYGMERGHVAEVLGGAEIAGWIRVVDPREDLDPEGWTWRLCCEGDALCLPIYRFVERTLGITIGPCVQCVAARIEAAGPKVVEAQARAPGVE
jgi:hypothetical protein